MRWLSMMLNVLLVAAVCADVVIELVACAALPVLAAIALLRVAFP